MAADGFMTRANVKEAEARLLALVENDEGNEPAILKAINELEGVGKEEKADRATREGIDGKWVLVYSTKSTFDPRNPLGSRVDGTAPLFEGILRNMLGGDNPASAAASASPIQRTVLSSDFVVVTQDVAVLGPEKDRRVDQTVSLAQNAVTLKLSAVAERCEGDRIDFCFDEAFFDFNGFRVPYPVPFRLLGDEARGWLDTSYLSENIRISKGNKGTTFVLRRQL